jgi:hypothetical protein
LKEALAGLFRDNAILCIQVWWPSSGLMQKSCSPSHGRKLSLPLFFCKVTTAYAVSWVGREQDCWDWEQRQCETKAFDVNASRLKNKKKRMNTKHSVRFGGNLLLKKGVPGFYELHRWNGMVFIGRDTIIMLRVWRHVRDTVLVHICLGDVRVARVVRTT